MTSQAAPAPARVPSYKAIPRLVRAVFLFIGALPWWIPVARARLDLGVLGDALDGVFVSMCHRLPERSLVVGGALMPVCSRCAGIFAGLAAGALIARPRLAMPVWRVILGIAAALMAADVITQDLGLHPVWHPARLATGFLLGYGMVVAFVTQLGAERR